MLTLSLTDRMYYHLSRRFGDIIKYSLTGYLHWDKESNRFVRVPGYYFLNWWFMCHIGYLVPFPIIAYTHTKAVSDSVPDEATVLQSSEGNDLIVLTSIVFVSFVVMAFVVTSALLNRTTETVAVFNDTFDLHHQLLNKYSHVLAKRFRTTPKSLEQLTAFICWFPICVPAFCCLSFLHPFDPIHNAFEEIFEITIGLNKETVIFLILEFYLVICLVTTASKVIMMCLIPLCLSHYWLNAGIPKCIIFKIRNGSAIPLVRTSGLGMLQEESSILLYQYQHLALNNINCVMKQVKCMSHFVGCLVMAVTASFSIIKYNHVLLDGSAMGLAFLGVLLTALCSPVCLVLVECALAQLLEEKWMEYKRRLVTLAPRNTSLNKTARSFRPVALKTGGEFFNVNRSTFMEWSDQAIDALVGLLVGF